MPFNAVQLCISLGIAVTIGVVVAAYQLSPQKPDVELLVPSTPVVATAGVPVETSVVVVNRTAQPIQVHGVRSGCGCLNVIEKPTVIPPKTDLPVECRMTAAYPGLLELTVEFYLESTRFPVLEGRVQFDVKAN